MEMEFVVHWTQMSSGKSGSKIFRAHSAVHMAVYLAHWNSQGTYFYCCPSLTIDAMGGRQRWDDQPEQVRDLGLTTG